MTLKFYLLKLFILFILYPNYLFGQNLIQGEHKETDTKYWQTDTYNLQTTDEYDGNAIGLASWQNDSFYFIFAYTHEGMGRVVNTDVLFVIDHDSSTIELQRKVTDRLEESGQLVDRHIVPISETRLDSIATAEEVKIQYNNHTFILKQDLKISISKLLDKSREN